jgi:hypothetical protein
MPDHSFSLQPFSQDKPLPPITITGAIGRRGQVLALRYELRGPRTDLVIPGPVELPARRHRLWEGTCFEFFLGVKEAPGYWEFNLSPAGHWNAYRFAGYREGMAEEGAITALPFRLRSRPDFLLLSLELDMAGILPAGQALMAGVAAVIQPVGGRATCWALTHCGPQPDFHRRESFILEM